MHGKPIAIGLKMDRKYALSYTQKGIVCAVILVSFAKYFFSKLLSFIRQFINCGWHLRIFTKYYVPKVVGKLFFIFFFDSYDIRLLH